MRLRRPPIPTATAREQAYSFAKYSIVADVKTVPSPSNPDNKRTIPAINHSIIKFILVILRISASCV